ncbi:MAG: hypothetical protein JW739_00475 [Opitutales bacterium]|nr:hypothetical protein [Opitutales bacterium]
MTNDTDESMVQNPSSEKKTIKAYDGFGREIEVGRDEWLNNVLLPHLKKSWDNADELYQSIYNGFNDGFFAEVEDACKRLYEIDEIKERGAVVLAVSYLQTNRPAEAKKVLLGYIEQQGESGIVLTNLAKAESALGADAEAERILWHALELEPNQENALAWYCALKQESDGSSLEVLKTVATMPDSWRAQIWLARERLKESDIDGAMALYRESLAKVPDPVPTEILMQISGDLGNKGHLPQILELTVPRYRIDVHGLPVANNLLKAYHDTGLLDRMRDLLKQLQLKQRPDWKKHLDYWEHQLSEADLSSEQKLSMEDIKVALLALEGPVWLRDGHPFSGLFPVKGQETPFIAFVGSSVTQQSDNSEIQLQQSTNAGRMTRSLPLFLSEYFSVNTNARTRVYIPWVENNSGGFALSGEMFSDEAIMSYHDGNKDYLPAQKPAYTVYTHLITQGKNWEVKLRLIRTVDTKCLAEFSYVFPEFSLSKVVDALLLDLSDVLFQETEMEFKSKSLLKSLEGSEFDHYLFRLEQALAVRCSAARKDRGLSNATEILEGTLHFCLNHLDSLPVWLLLTCVVGGMARKDSPLVKSFTDKIELLLTKLPAELPEGNEVKAEFHRILSEVNS